MRASRSFAFVLAVWIAVAFGGWMKAAAQAFQHPGVLVSKAQLDYMKAMVQAHQEPFYSAFIKAQNNSGSLTYTPQGPPTSTGGVIECGPTSNPNIGCSASDDDSTAAYEQALLWYITGNQTYANNAINILNMYAQNMKGYGPTATYSNTPLQAAWDAQKWPRAAEIIRYSNAGWSDADAKAFGQWMNTYILPQIINGTGTNGNWDVSMIEGMINIGIYNDDVATFNQGVTFWKQRIPAVFYYHTDGPQPVPAPRGTASWYGQTVFDASVDGIQQETCRDFGHAQYSLSGALDAAETARIQGVDLYNDAGSNALLRLTSALEFNAYYLMGNPVPLSVCGGTVTLQVYPVDEIGYNEYHNRLGKSLPNTLQYLQTVIRQLPDPTEYHIMVYESLTHGGDASSLTPFLLTTNNTSATVQQGKSATLNVQVIPGTDPNPVVNLAVSGLPSGATYSFNPATVTGAGSSTLTINIGSTTNAGSYNITITGSSAGGNGIAPSTFTNTVNLVINRSDADFSLSASPVTVNSAGGDTSNFTITFNPLNNYMGSATLSVTSGLPAGASASFSSTNIGSSATMSVFTVTTASTTPAGAYPITISATDGTNTHTTQAVLVVAPISSSCIQQLGNYWINGALPVQKGTFTAEWDSAPSTALNNSNVGLSLGVQTAFTGLAVAARFNPTGTIDARNGGAFAADNNIPYTAGTVYHFRAVVNVPANTYSLYVTPAGQSEITVGSNYSFRSEQAGITSIDHWDATSQVGTISICNMVIDGPDFTLTETPASQAITAGSTAQYTTTFAAMGGYTGTVTLSASNAPAGTTVTFNPATLGGTVTSSIMTVASTPAAPLGAYAITVSATDGTTTHTAYPELSINPPCLAPAAAGQSLTVQENSALAVTLAGTLGSGCSSADTLTYQVAANPAHGVLTGTAPNLMYTPSAGYVGADSFTFTVKDANATVPTSSAATVAITVTAPVSGAPVLSSISPNIVPSGSAAFTLTVKGTGFTSGSTVMWNGASRTTTYVSATQVTAAIAATDVAYSGIDNITVSNPGASGGTSGALMLAVDSSTSIALDTTATQITITHGQTGSLSISFSNMPANMQSTVGCYNLPASANCSYSVSTRTLTITTGMSTPAGTYQILLVSNTTPAQTAAIHRGASATMLCGLFGLPLGLVCFGSRRRRWFALALLAFGLVLTFATGCGSSIKVAPAGSTQASAAVTLTVN